MGDVVLVEAARQGGGFQLSKGVTRLVLRDANGALLLYVQDHNGVFGFAPPAEIDVAVGSVECQTNDGCGDVLARSFAVTVENASEVVPFGGERVSGRIS